MRIRNGVIARGTPAGKNKLLSFHLCLVAPIKFTPTKCARARKKVTPKELVTVNAKGISPTRFATRRVENK